MLLGHGIVVKLHAIAILTSVFYLAGTNHKEASKVDDSQCDFYCSINSNYTFVICLDGTYRFLIFCQHMYKMGNIPFKRPLVIRILYI